MSLTTEIVKRVPRNEIYKLISSHLAERAVAIADCEGGVWGTGIPLEIKDKKIIVTAGHVLQDLKKENLRFVPYDRGKMKFSSAKKIGRPITEEKHSQEVRMPVKALKIYGPDQEDIGIILLDNLTNEQLDRFRFIKINTTQTKIRINSKVYIAGFAEEIKTDIRRKNWIHRILRLYTEDPVVIKDPERLINFNSKINFLLQFPDKPILSDGMYLMQLKGISGCGVWKLKMSKSSGVFHLDSDLHGIQTRIYGDSRIFKCTKRKILLKRISEYLSELREDGGVTVGAGLKGQRGTGSNAS